MAGGVPVILTGEEEINPSSLTVARGELVIGEFDTVIIIMSLAFDSSDDAADEEVNGGGDAPVTETRITVSVINHCTACSRKKTARVR